MTVQERASSYVIVAVVSIGGSLAVRSSGWLGETNLHTAMEIVATLLAAFAGSMALVRFHARREARFLYLGLGFLGAALLDGFHGFVTSQWFVTAWPSPPPSLAPWSWYTGRLTLAAVLLLTLWASTRDSSNEDASRRPERVAYPVIGAIALTSFAIFAFVPLPRAYYPELPTGRPQELVPGVLFVLALIGFLRSGSWKSDVVDHSIVLCLVFQSVAQVAVMPFSFRLFDAPFDIAHVLKIAGYGAVLVGSLVSVHRLHRRAEANARAAMENAREAQAHAKRAEEALARSLEVEHESARRAEELARINAELDDFAYAASHDLREPLRGIITYSSLLLEDHGRELRGEARAHIDALTALSKRMYALVGSLLEYSRTGGAASRMRRVDLERVVHEVVGTLRPILWEVDVRVPVPFPTVVCDRSRVAQVFHNLIANAITFNDKENRWVEIGWREDRASGGPMFYVKDNGIGIDERDREAVLRVFRRVHDRDAYGGGSGVGLSIVRRHIEAHGGGLWIDSVPDEGTTFRFTLAPLAAGPSPMDVERERAAPARRSESLEA